MPKIMKKNESHLYRFLCSQEFYEGYGIEEQEDLDFCSTCEDRVCYFVATPQNWYDEFCKLIVTKYQTLGKYDEVWKKSTGVVGGKERLPKSFLCMECYQQQEEEDPHFQEEEYTRPMIEQLLASDELREELEQTCLRDLGPINKEEIEGLKKKKIYLHIKTPPNKLYRGFKVVIN